MNTNQTNLPFTIYTKDNCPDTLAWSSELNMCSLECIYPFYSHTEQLVLDIIDYILVPIGFVLCYLFCLTCLIRPLARKFPNTIIVFMHFSLLIFLCSNIVAYILGKRYVYCDTNTTLATQDNWACTISVFLLKAVLHIYGILSAIAWNTIYHIVITLRVYLIKLPKKAPYLSFLFSYGFYPLTIVIVGLSLEYTAFSPGSFNCFFGEKNFIYGGIISMYYFFCVIILLCVLLIIIRLIKVKVRTNLSWKIIFTKQARLISYWIFYVYYIVSATLLMATLGNYNDTEESIEEYVKCVLIAGDDEDCELNVEGYIPYWVFLSNHISALGYPIVVFLVFGCRKQFFLFWKEYFIYAWKNKTIPIQFVPSFDPSSSKTSGIISSVSDNSLPNFTKETKKLIKRIQAI